MSKRVILIVMDSVGIGALPDAEKYGDETSDTLGNIAQQVGGLMLPNLERLGLGNIKRIAGVEPISSIGSFGILEEKSNGKDTTTGHWEMIGIVTTDPFPTYPKGFPEEIIKEFEYRIGRKVLGNEVASGTEIINRLGNEHINTGCPIVYTSADSVFQIAAHEDIIPLEELYEICHVARELLNEPPHQVGRIIARPFIGELGHFTRTPNRHDYSLLPPTPNLLTDLQDQGIEVYGIGKIADIFAQVGINYSRSTIDNIDGMKKLEEIMNIFPSGLVMVNLVDFDSKYGHRNDVDGYAHALEQFDSLLSNIINQLQEEDILIITSDHGCDPTTASSDHSREYVPLLLYGPKILSNVNLGTLYSFGNIGATIADYFNIEYHGDGESFLNLIKK